MSQPNLILIICDQLRADTVGAYGNPCVQTPNIDALAAAGTRFDHAYSAVPSCLPARACLMTGQNQWNAGILGMGRGQGQVPNDYPHTLAGELTAAGYQTHMVGKGHFHPMQSPMGFESTELDEAGRGAVVDFEDDYRRFFRENAPPHITPEDHGVDWNSWHARPWHTEEYLHPTAWTGTRAIEWLKQRDTSRPFFLNISFDRPHSPYVPPQAYWDQYINSPTRPAVIGDWAACHDDPAEAADPNAWRGRMTPEQIHRARAGYYGDCSFIDTQVGRLRNWMRRFDREASRNTWIIFTSDHGDMLGDHNLWRKTYAYEGSTRIPMIVTPPMAKGRPEVGIANPVVELRDVMPALLDAAGVACPATVDGQSLLQLMNGQDSGWRDYLHGEHCTCYAEEQEMQFVTDGHRKFIWLPRVDSRQFFDLDKDPDECHDLINDPTRQDEIALWQQRLTDELAARDCGWVVDGNLHCPPGEPLVSPFRDERRQADRYTSSSRALCF